MLSLQSLEKTTINIVFTLALSWQQKSENPDEFLYECYHKQ